MKEQSSGWIKNYTRYAEIFRQITETKLKLKLPPQVVNAWQTTLVAMRFADQLLDTSNDSNLRNQEVQKGLSYLKNQTKKYENNNPQLVDSLVNLKSELENFSDNQRNMFLRNLTLLCKVTEKLKDQDNLGQFVRFRKLEGQIASKLFISLLPPEATNSLQYADYVKLMSRSGRLNNCYDSFKDLADDYARNEVKIKPTWPNRFKILTDSTSDGLEALKLAGPVVIFKVTKTKLGLKKRQAFKS